MSFFRIKICGVTSPEDALSAVEAGADALGLNFVSASPRSVSPATAAKIMEAVRRAFPTSPTIVGVFANSPPQELARIVRGLQLRWIQLHGHEDHHYIRTVVDLLGEPVMLIRAFRPRTVDDLASLQQFLQQLAISACVLGQAPEGATSLQAILLDAYSHAALGGTGQVADWTLATTCRHQLCPAFGVKLILAGGLNPANVAQAIRIVRPDAVDVASGVEFSPGKKDPLKIRQLVAQARVAWEELSFGST